MIRETILVADDHPLFRGAMALAVANVRPDVVIVEAATLDDAATAARDAKRLALILLDLKMPGADGFTGVALLHAERPETPILVVSGLDAPTAAAEARRFGAVGFVGKGAELAAIEGAIAAALAGDTIEATADPELDEVAGRVAQLTPTQLRVLLGLLRGRLNKQIAHELAVTEATVKAHMTAIMRKLDVHNRTQAVLAARALGLGLEH